MAYPSSRAERRRELVQILQRHTQALISAESVRAVGVRLRDETLRHRTERGTLLNLDTGVEVGDAPPGTTERIDAGSLLRKMRVGRRYVFVHTHPDGRSFSESDVAGLVAHWPLPSVVVAVGSQGTWYAISVEPESKCPSPADVAVVLRQESDALAPKYSELLQTGTLTRRDAQRQFTHEVWERIAPRLGLRYDRV
jgi:hypothetical protein